MKGVSLMKKIASLLLLCTLILCTLTACGKDEDEYLSKEEKEMLDEVEDGFGDEMEDMLKQVDENKQKAKEEKKEDEPTPTSSEEAIWVDPDDLTPTPEIVPFELVEVSDEIKNSKLTDEIVQVGNVVLPNDFSLTVKEAIDLLSQDGEVSMGDGYTPDLLIPGSDGHIKDIKKLPILRAGSGMDPLWADDVDVICNIYFYNLEESPTNIMDCIVFDFSRGSLQNALNFFWSGNLYCEGLTDISYLSGKPGFEEAIKQRSEEYPLHQMTYQEAHDYLEKMTKDADVEAEWSSSGAEYSFTFNSKEIVPGQLDAWDGSEDLRRQTRYTFVFDLKDNSLKSFGRSTSFYTPR